MSIAYAPSAAKCVPLAELESEMMALYGPRFRAMKTRKQMEALFRRLKQLNVQSTADFTVALIARVIESYPASHSPFTTRGVLLRLQTVFGFAEKCGYIIRSPFAIRPVKSWVRVPARPPGRRHLGREEVKLILDQLRRDCETTVPTAALWRARRLYALTSVIAYCGLRRNEGLFLQVDDIDLPNRLIYVVDRAAHRCKTASSADPVVIPEALVEPLASWMEHRLDAPPGRERVTTPYLFPNSRKATPWTGGIKNSRPIDKLRQAAQRAGVKSDVSWHCLRRSLATHLELHGLGGAMISRCLRHSSQQITENFYRRQDLTNLKGALRDFRY
jgi:integrase